MENKKDRIIALIFFLVMIAVNAFANIIPINNINTGEVSNLYPNLFAPIALTFSIWGIIYLFLGIYSIYQLTNFIKLQFIKKITLPFIISSIANSLWIFSWHYDYIFLSLIFMIIILLCLININLFLDKQGLDLKEKLFIKTPFTIYFAWITIATIANIIALLINLNWNGFGISESIWMIIVLSAGLIITLFRLIKTKDYIFSVTIIWAYLGIFLKHNSSNYFSWNYPLVIYTTIFAILLIFLTALFVKKKVVLIDKCIYT